MGAEFKPKRRNAMYEIEKNIPLPRPREISRQQTKYPFSIMQVGDSFSVDIGKEPEMKVLRRVSVACNRIQLQSGGKKRFTTRMVDDRTRVRVWRVE